MIEQAADHMTIYAEILPLNILYVSLRICFVVWTSGNNSSLNGLLNKIY